MAEPADVNTEPSSNETDAYAEFVCTEIIGKTILGVELIPDEETVVISFDTCTLEFTGDGLSMKYAVPERLLQ